MRVASFLPDKGLLETGHHITTLIPLKETGHSSVSKLIAVELPMKYLYVARKDYLLMVLMVTVLADLIIYFALHYGYYISGYCYSQFLEKKTYKGIYVRP